MNCRAAPHHAADAAALIAAVRVGDSRCAVRIDGAVDHARARTYLRRAEDRRALARAGVAAVSRRDAGGTLGIHDAIDDTTWRRRAGPRARVAEPGGSCLASIVVGPAVACTDRREIVRACHGARTAKGTGVGRAAETAPRVSAIFIGRAGIAGKTSAWPGRGAGE